MKNILILAFVMISATGLTQTIQDFSLTNVVDGTTVSLNEFESYQGIAIIFTSNECPYDNQYRERIKTLNQQYKGTIQFLLINSHVKQRENVTAMTQKFRNWGLLIPYLADKDQIALRSLGAEKSPEVFLLKKNGIANTIVYKGAIDDNPLVGTDVNNFYLKIAIDEMLANQKVKLASTRAVGCMIRKKHP